MSSYVCSAKHFNSLERGTIKVLMPLKNGDVSTGKVSEYPFKKEFNQFFKDEPNGYGLSGTWKKLCGDRIKNEIPLIFDELRRLNVICVTLQYKEEYAGKVDTQIEFETEYLQTNKRDYKELSKHGLYNGLRCLHYQIEEEHSRDLK